MLCKKRLMKCAQLREFAQIFLNDSRVVLQEKPLQIFRYETEQTEKCKFWKSKGKRNIKDIFQLILCN